MARTWYEKSSTGHRDIDTAGIGVAVDATNDNTFQLIEKKWTALRSETGIKKIHNCLLG